MGVGVAFTDVTRYHRLQAELQDANQALERAYDELQSTNDELSRRKLGPVSLKERISTLGGSLAIAQKLVEKGMTPSAVEASKDGPIMRSQLLSAFLVKRIAVGGPFASWVATARRSGSPPAATARKETTNDGAALPAGRH